MGQSVIGALRVNLGLDSAQFSKGARRAQAPLAKLKAQLASLAAVAGVVGGALSAAALAGARDIDKAAKSARRLDSSIGGFRALELAAGEAGVSLSGLTNDLQTMDREIASIGVTGNGQRALDALGLSIEDLAGLDADEKLAKIADQVQNLGLSSGQTTAILRDLGVRNREMVLLVGQGGAAIRQARQDLEDYGLAGQEVDAMAPAMERANDRIARLAFIGRYAAQQIAQELAPALGRMAQGMTDSLRAGGVLRVVIDALAGNIRRLGTYMTVAVTALGVRYVAAAAMAKVATFSLAGAMLALRRAIMLTGIGLIVVAAGELVFRLNNLVIATGGWGGALAALGKTASAVWSGIQTSAKAIPVGLKAIWLKVQAGFVEMIENLQRRWYTFLVSMSKGLAGIGLDGMSSQVAQAAEGAGLVLDNLIGKSDALASSADSQAAAADALANKGWGQVKTALGDLAGLSVSASEDMTSGATAADALSGALDGVEQSSGGAAKGVKEAKTATEKLEDGMKNVESSARSAFTGLVTGAKNAKDALGEVLNSLASMFANQAFDSLTGSMFGDGNILSGLIPGNANGTHNFAGGLSWVGERGPELVNLPRGSQVIPAQKSSQMMGGGTSVLRVELGDGVKADILQQAQGQSVQITQSGLKQRQSQFTNNINTHQERGTAG